MSRTIDVPLAALQRVRELHARVDESATRIASALGARLRCARGCCACCVDDLEVSRTEAAAIVDAFPHVIAAGAGKVGSCAMLDAEGACRVYAARPYVCRTQGLPLRWLERDEDAGEVVERRDVCPLNELPAASGEAAALEDIPPSACWTLGRAEEVLATIDRLPGQASSIGSAGARVNLRGLFAATASKPATNPQ